MFQPPESDLAIDKENAFLLYATFCGDVVKTAHALSMPPEQVAKLADTLRWNEKLAPILALKKSTRPGDIERAMNRALNFVQAHQFRLFVSRCIQRFTSMSEKELDEFIFQGKPLESKSPLAAAKVSTRGIADLAQAMERCQTMTYQALNDTTSERVKRAEVADPEVTAADMHARIAAGMAAISDDNSPQAKLLDAQLAEAARLKDALKNS
jgi:ABC-type sugar transport system ATPase subunit